MTSVQPVRTSFNQTVNTLQPRTVAPIQQTPAKLANGMHSPESLVHSIYGTDKSVKNLKEAFLTTGIPQKTSTHQIAQTVQATRQTQLLQPTVLPTPAPSSTLNSLLQIQQNQTQAIANLNQKHLNDVKLLQASLPTSQLTGSLSSSSLLSSSQNQVLPSQTTTTTSVGQTNASTAPSVSSSSLLSGSTGQSVQTVSNNLLNSSSTIQQGPSKLCYSFNFS
jgi:hypothetical protein